MKLPTPPPPEGPIRFRPAPLDEDRVRQGQRNAAVVAARKAEEDRRQRDEEEKYPLLDLGDGRPPIRARGSRFDPFAHRTRDGAVLVGRPMPGDPITQLQSDVAGLREELAALRDTLASTTPTPARGRRWPFRD